MSHPPFDFETYSEAGYVWNEEMQRFDGPPGAPKGKKGLPVIGAAVYSEHESTEILVLNYDLLDGRGVRQWYPGWPAPQDLFDHLAAGGTLEAHNLPFERWLWRNVCVPRLGWPSLDQYESQLFCSMAKARAYAYPPSLDQATKIAGVSEKKDAAGAALMKKFSMPVKPTKANGFKKRFTYADDPDEYMRYTQGYGGQDVIAEHALSQVVPEMIPLQRDYYLHDQRINTRGVHMDMRAVHGAISIIEQAFAKYDHELQSLTGGIKSTELAKLQGWCAGMGFSMAAMDEDAVTEALKHPDIPAVVARVLELRQTIGSASVKKVFAIRNQITKAGRLHDLFVFHGARTGRPTGSGPQPTNLPKAGPDVWKCMCKKHYHHSMTTCPWCGGTLRMNHAGVPFPPGGGKPSEWNPDAAEDAFSLVYLGSLDILEMYFGEAMLTLAGCMRGMFDAAEGHDMVSSDFTAIEAVVLACMAGEQWRVDLFRNKGKIYEASGAKVVGLSYEEILQYAKDNGRHHPARQVGKTCLGPDTQVLTDSGWLAIVDVLQTHKVWDGEQWVSHAGLIRQGKKKVINLDGVVMTPDHRINCDGSWKEAKLLVSHERMKSQALATGSESLRCWARSTEKRAASLVFPFSVRAGSNRTACFSQICFGESQLGATPVQKKQAHRKEKCIGPTRTRCQTTSIDADYSIGFPPPLAAATTQRAGCTQITGAGEFPFARNGERTGGISSPRFNFWKGGTTQLWKWIVSTATETTRRTMSGLSAAAKTQETSEKFPKCKPVSTTWSDVYDIANAGPRTRFTIKTDSGAMVVHNCELGLGYQGWIGAWKAFDTKGEMSDDDIKQVILAWRDASPAIVEFWGGQTRRQGYGKPALPELFGVEGHFLWQALNPGTDPTTYRGLMFSSEVYHIKTEERVEFQKVSDESSETIRVVVPAMDRDACRVFITLPSGRTLTYHDVTTRDNPARPWSPRAMSYWGYNTNPKNGPIGWIQMDTWGGRLTENIVQAIANDILRFSTVTLEANGYPIVLHVYDEIVSEIPEGFGSIEEFERLMSTLPAWAVCDDRQPWPIFVDGGWRAKRYRKG